MIFRLKGLFKGKNFIVFLLVAISFHTLFRYRANPDVLKAGSPAPNLELRTLDGQTFSLYDYNIPVMLVFLNTSTFWSSPIYPEMVLKRLPRLKLFEDQNLSGMIVLLDVQQKPDAVKKVLNDKKYKLLENIVYLGNIDLAKKAFGLSSWPHFFMIDETHTIVYQAKIPMVDVVDTILTGS